MPCAETLHTSSESAGESCTADQSNAPLPCEDPLSEERRARQIHSYSCTEVNNPTHLPVHLVSNNELHSQLIDGFLL